MDNSNQVFKTNPSVLQPKTGGSNKGSLWLIVGLMAVILIIGGTYWYLKNQQIEKPVSAPQTAEQSANLNQEIDAINVGDSDSDFADIDSDLQSL